MTKHPNGKHIIKMILHNEKSLYVYVIKGVSENFMPKDKFPEDMGELHLSLPATIKDFDFELNEMLNESKVNDALIFLCANDVVFEYAYGRIRAWDK